MSLNGPFFIDRHAHIVDEFPYRERVNEEKKKKDAEQFEKII